MIWQIKIGDFETLHVEEAIWIQWIKIFIKDKKVITCLDQLILVTLVGEQSVVSIDVPCRNVIGFCFTSSRSININNGECHRDWCSMKRIVVCTLDLNHVREREVIGIDKANKIEYKDTLYFGIDIIQTTIRFHFKLFSML